MNIDLRLVAALSMAAACAVASAQNYPTKPIRILTGETGGGNDLVSRMIAQAISGPLGQQVIVDNRGITAIEMAAKAPADGYTLLVYSSLLWLLPFIRDNVPYDPVRDFSGITAMGGSPNILAVHPAVPAKSVEELIAVAKARPGALNYGSGSSGAPPHLAAELFKAMAGVDIVRINYKGGGPANLALIAGQVQLMFATAGSVTAHIQSGRVRALAVTSLQPSPLAPGLPTVAASGLPGYESGVIYTALAPVRTPAAVVSRLNREIVAALGRSDLKDKFLNMGIEIIGNSPAQVAVMIRAEMTKWGKVIKDAKIHE